MRRGWIMLALVLLVAAALPATAGVMAQGDYTLTWWTADGGGGTSSNGGYVVSGAAGQADAAGWQGEGYTLLGGFWPGGEPAGAGYSLFLPVVVRE
jgi:hypothetical protein